MFKLGFETSIMVSLDTYLRIGHLPRFDALNRCQAQIGQFCVYLFDSKHPDDVEILGSKYTIEEALIVFDSEMKKRGFKTKNYNLSHGNTGQAF